MHEEVMERPAHGAFRTLHYGDDAAQCGDLYLPQGTRPPVVVLLHGGFWRMPHGRDQLHDVAVRLCERGFAVWNLGYRRVGAPGGGWPGTLDDVARGIDHLARVDAALDLDRVVLVGHSAGGQLALWAGARRDAIVRASAVAALAPVCDLDATHADGSGDGAVHAFLGGSPGEVPARYADASPMRRLPLGVPQYIAHGDRDELLPLAVTERYVAAARATGDNVDLDVIRNGGHMDFIDPDSAAFAALSPWLDHAFR